jgi:transcriptional regulator with XRE-family HTH domain
MRKTEDMIASWVRATRKEAGLSQEALGAKLALELGEERGFTKANISHWENRKHSPNLKQLVAIAKITGRTLPQDLLEAIGGSAPPIFDDLNTSVERTPEQASSTAESARSFGRLSGLASLLELKADSAQELRLLTIYRLANDREREAIDDAINEVSALIEMRTSHETKRTG